ncbi:TPA: CaiF/GrlA family transcriptional regulator [Salmonella enterica subsp. enterica serovar Muenchen]|nr:CaiF/GrlA family transcriptional regulator [Salmonella enterica subsp. enterica serovar Muenchen]HEC8860550.1 CaiF/GrlA family transcriptional regulator [Salmonella enterica subsp. enterica serovar Muenchen]
MEHKIARNSNSSYTLPESIKHLKSLPLYMAVAWWGYLRGKIFNRDDVSEAFQIDPHRASGIINYLARRVDPKKINLEISMSKSPNASRQLCVYIHSITETKEKRTLRTRVSKTTKDRKTESENRRKLAYWWFSRPSVTDTAKYATWQASCPVKNDA